MQKINGMAQQSSALGLDCKSEEVWIFESVSCRNPGSNRPSDQKRT